MRTTRGVSRSSHAGFSLVEFLISLSVFGITMASMTVMQLNSMALSRSNQEASRAMDAAQSVIERLRDEPNFLEIYARWNADASDDPDATAPGNAFDVTGLEPARDDADGHVGEVVFPGNGTSLLENLHDPSLGTPRDLDLDGDVDGDDLSGTYRLLPVLVRVRWQGARTVEEIRLVGTLAPR
jgi:prepilin-type N-terminal cleavage/methylation domain-containing protein